MLDGHFVVELVSVIVLVGWLSITATREDVLRLIIGCDAEVGLEMLISLIVTCGHTLRQLAGQTLVSTCVGFDDNMFKL